MTAQMVRGDTNHGVLSCDRVWETNHSVLLVKWFVERGTTGCYYAAVGGDMNHSVLLCNGWWRHEPLRETKECTQTIF